jgi:putative proteasome-type protease
MWKQVQVCRRDFATFCKMTLFERPGDRVVVLLSSGNLAGTQAVVSVLKQRNAPDGVSNLWGAESLFDAAMLVSGGCVFQRARQAMD